MKRRLKLVATVVVVTLALSGFAQARGGSGKGGGGKSRGGSGGGCGRDTSSSGSNLHRSHTGTAGGSSGSSSGPSRDREPDAEVVSCATTRKGTVVELSGGSSGTYTVRVDLVDDFGDVVDTVSRRVGIRAGQTERVEVKPRDPSMADAADDCRVTVG
ncbi:hypothetical protein ACFSJS_02865 [Streptomyces desertarenae]|uniref:DUF5666 domain-containing protein n=1 Tax=Streptomyces desertarenae TaxID=2666184 RepID=A0ABW4PEL9_9ACTN